MTSRKTICLTFTFKSYSGLTVTGRNLNGELPKMGGKSSFEKRRCGDDMINKAPFFFIFYMPFLSFIMFLLSPCASSLAVRF